MPNDGPRHGDLVEVRSAAEILATLDERGMLEGLPFMPEMVRYCGQQFVVDKRAEKICDTIYPLGSRRLPDTVLLGDMRCDGSGHDGCQADCRIFWKQAWLRKADRWRPARPAADDAQAVAALHERLAKNTKITVDVNGASAVRYRCQNTELHRASHPLHTYDPRAYLRVYRAGNVSLGRFLRVLARAAVEEPMRKLGLTPKVWVRGSTRGLARDKPLDLKPGDLVQVKSKEEIIATLSPDGKNRGLFFDREMLPYCGRTLRVKHRLTRFIDDRRGGEMIQLNTDCVTLEGAVCSGELSPVRWFCPREIKSFWREVWLRRVDEPTDGVARSRAISDEPDLAVEELVHHPGIAQVDDGDIAVELAQPQA
jgi:hypothetical protein